MKNQRDIALRRVACAVLGSAAGIVVFWMLYGTMTLDVTNDSWILNSYDETAGAVRYAGSSGRHCHFLHRQPALGQYLLQTATRDSSLHVPVVRVVYSVLLCHAGGGGSFALYSRQHAFVPAGPSVWNIGWAAVCLSAYTVGESLPPRGADLPVSVPPGTVCVSGIPHGLAGWQDTAVCLVGVSGAELCGGGDPSVFPAACHDLHPAGRGRSGQDCPPARGGGRTVRRQHCRGTGRWYPYGGAGQRSGGFPPWIRGTLHEPQCRL